MTIATSFWRPIFFIVSAFGASVFFEGQPNMWVLALVVLSLSLWLGWELWEAYSKNLWNRQGLLFGFIIGGWVWSGLSWFWSISPSMTSQFFWWTAGLPLAYLAMVLNPLSEKQWRVVLATLRVVGLLLVIYALWLWFKNGDTNFRATFINHNNLAALLNLLLFPVVAEFISPSRSGRQLLLRGAVIFILALGVALTIGRGAGLSLVGGVVVLLLVSRKYISTQRVALVGMLIVAAYISSHLLHQGETVVARIASLSSENIVGSAIPRLIIWEATWLMGAEHPWLGSGLGTFAHQYLEFQHPNDGARYFAHNDYLQSWQEGGVIRELLLLGRVGGLSKKFYCWLLGRGSMERNLYCG